MDTLTHIASDILQAARIRGQTIDEWFLSPKEYDEYLRASEGLSNPKIKICGTSIRSKTDVVGLVQT
jgi:hypothetical protein